MADRQLDALREDVHKALMEAGVRCGASCDDVAEFLVEVGWRHPEITASEESE